MSDNYLTFQEVALRLKIGKTSVYRRIADGTLPQPIKIGHLRRFKASEIDEALLKLSDKRGAALRR